MRLDIKEPVYIMSKKDYATGERTFEGICLNNQNVNVQLIITFKNKEDKIQKDFFILGGQYNMSFENKEG